MRGLLIICSFILSGTFYGQVINSGQKTNPIPDHNITYINDYSRVLSFNICDNKITVEDAADFFAGDTILLIQMQGAAIDSSNSAGFGNIIDYNNTGNYEFNYIKSVSGNTIELKNILTRKYDIPNGRVQIVRVPSYRDLEVVDPLSCPAWNGATGGVLVFIVEDTLTLFQDVFTDSRGFRGGSTPNINPNTLACGQTGYYADSAAWQFARKGEGVAILNFDKWNGRGKFSNGGGGGNGHNSGGGGGGNYGPGGSGGNQLDSCGNAPFSNGGIGGAGLIYNNSSNKLFMGGGGGAGHMDSNNPSFKADGGAGAGILIIKAGYIRTNNRLITANGDRGQYCFNCSNDGTGGGGAGGTILLDIDNYLDSVSINANGGDGSWVLNYSSPSQRVGPGGGGSGGVVWFAGNVPAVARITKMGGVKGIIYADSNNPWGATSGNDGSVLNNLSLIVDTIPFIAMDVHASKSNDIDCYYGSSQLSASGALHYLWQPTTTLSDPSIADPQASPAEQTTYMVTGTDANGCVDTDTVTVKISTLNRSPNLLPTAFSPNNDGLNDCFGIKGWGLVQQLDMAIYNRWGEMVFHSNDPGRCWDGKYKGENQPIGVYIYVVTAKTACGDVHKKGVFALIR